MSALANGDYDADAFERIDEYNQEKIKVTDEVAIPRLIRLCLDKGATASEIDACFNQGIK